MTAELIVAIVGEIALLAAVIWRGGVLVGRIDTVIEQHENRLNEHGDLLDTATTRVAALSESLAYIRGKIHP